MINSTSLYLLLIISFSVKKQLLNEFFLFTNDCKISMAFIYKLDRHTHTILFIQGLTILNYVYKFAKECSLYYERAKSEGLTTYRYQQFIKCFVDLNTNNIPVKQSCAVSELKFQVSSFTLSNLYFKWVSSA